MAALKSKALSLGADSVQIHDAEPPHLPPACRVNTFRVSGVALRRADPGAIPKGTADARAPSRAGNAERLREANRLREEGLLSEAECETQKAAILAEGL